MTITECVLVGIVLAFGIFIVITIAIRNRR